MYADFETANDKRPVSSHGGLVQLVSYQESPSSPSRFKSLEGSNPPAPELVHLKQGDPNRAIAFDYELVAPNQYAGVGVTMGIDQVAQVGCAGGATDGARFFSPAPAYHDAAKYDASFFKATQAAGLQSTWQEQVTAAEQEARQLRRDLDAQGRLQQTLQKQLDEECKAREELTLQVDKLLKPSLQKGKGHE